MHVGLITTEFPPMAHGGIGSLSHDLAHGLAEAGFEVTVLLMTRSQSSSGFHMTNERVVTPRLQVLHTDYGAKAWLGWRLGEIALRLQLARFLNQLSIQRRFDSVFCYEDNGWFPYPGLSRPCVVQVSGNANFFRYATGGTVENPFLLKLEGRTLRRADCVVANSHFTAQTICKLHSLQLPRMEVIYNPVDVNLFSPDEAAHEEDGLIVFHNSIEPRKGVPELLAAFERVLAKVPQARLVLAGRDVRQDAHGRPLSVAYWEALPPPVRERVSFIGPQERASGVLPLLRRASVCCYPSHIETFGIAPVEAMATGKAVVLGAAGPGPELVEDGRSGRLCRPSDITGLASLLVELLQDRAQRKALGLAARERAVKLFAKERFIAENVRVFRSLARSSSAAPN